MSLISLKKKEKGKTASFLKKKNSRLRRTRNAKLNVWPNWRPKLRRRLLNPKLPRRPKKKTPAPVVEEPVVTTGGKKKKKKKNKKDNKKKEEEEPAPKPIDQGWTTLPIKKEVLAKKKANKGDNDGPSITGEISVAARHFATIKGPGSVTMNTIQDKLGVSLNIPKKGSSDTKILITGPASAVDQAKEVIQDIAEKGYSKLTHGDVEDVTMEVTNLGLLIGPGGSHVKAIQSKTSTQIKLPAKDSKDDKQITILGDPAAVQEAVSAINELMASGYSDLTHEGWIKETVNFPGSMIGVLVGPKGENIRRLQTSFNTRINVPNVSQEDAKSRIMTITIVGPQDGVENVKRQIEYVQTDFRSKEVEFPSAMLSALIGSGGANIKRIQSQTNTRINIEEHLWDPSLKAITIDGFEKDIAAAEKAFAVVLAANTRFEIDFPTDRMGILIGKKGEAIKSLQQKTGCRISVNAHEWDESVKEVVVDGSIDGVAAVREELERLMKPRPRQPKQNKVAEEASDDAVDAGVAVE